jgi:amidase
MFVDAPTGTPVDPEVQAAVRSAGRRCEGMGHHVEEIACPFEARAIDDFLRYWGFVAWVQVATARQMMHRGFDRTKVEAWTGGLASYFLREKLATFAAIRRLRQLSRVFCDVMARGHDVLLSPTLAEPAPAIGYLATDVYDVHFERVRAYAPFTAIYNAAGVPAISLPGGLGSAGLPIGVQLAAGHGDDRLVLELAREMEIHPVAVAPARLSTS